MGVRCVLELQTNASDSLFLPGEERVERDNRTGVEIGKPDK